MDRTWQRRFPRIPSRARWAILAVWLVLGSGCGSLFDRGADETPTPRVSLPTDRPASTMAATPAAVVTTTAEGTIIDSPPIPTRPQTSGQQRLTIPGTVDGPNTLDPAMVRDVDSAFIVRQVFRGLVRFDDQLEPMPDLAQRIEISADGRRYRFTLREDLEFHDGRPLAADDVKFSLERATDPALAGGDGAALAANIYLHDIVGASERLAGRATGLDGLLVLDPRTVEIRLVEPSPTFLLRLAGTPAMIVDRDDVSRTDWWRTPNGSGPFALESWEPGERIVLRGTESYVPSPPILETVEILLGANALQPLTLYERGSIDISEVPAYAIDRVSASGNSLQSELRVQPLLSVSYVMLNPNAAPLNNPDLRRALVQAFDRAKIADVTLDGHVEVAEAVVPQGAFDWTWQARLSGYDLAAARDTLARVSNEELGEGLTFYTAGTYALVAMKEVYARDLDLPVEVIQLEWSDYVDDLTHDGLPVLGLDWVADYPDPETFLRALFHSGSPDNYIGYSNPEVDQLLDRASTEPDRNRRLALYDQAQQKILDDAVVIPLYNSVDRIVVKPYVQGLSLTPMGILGLESVWISR